jgi:hypothetical protein
MIDELKRAERAAQNDPWHAPSQIRWWGLKLRFRRPKKGKSGYSVSDRLRSILGIEPDNYFYLRWWRTSVFKHMSRYNMNRREFKRLKTYITFGDDLALHAPVPRYSCPR